MWFHCAQVTGSNLLTDNVKQMPVMDGLTCTKKIRDMQKTASIRGYVPIIAVTANARSEQISTAKDSGMVSNHCPLGEYKTLNMSVLFRRLTNLDRTAW